MATRTDLSVDYQSSPRIVTVAEPSDEIVMQDLVDTLRVEHEHSFTGMGFDKLLNASGKEELGGGVTVGITVALQNLRLAFEGRTTPAETGTVTGSPASPVAGRQIIQDSTATFITNGISRGSLVINFTDRSIADVVSVDSETQLTTKTLVNGVGNTYDTFDDYQVFNITQVSALGGNLVAVDEAQAIIDAILPTAFTQVLLTSSSSATTQNQTSLEFSTYNNRVTVKLGSGNSGTTYPTGTPGQPVDNIPDAIAIIALKGLPNIIQVLGDYTFDTGDNISNATVMGENSERSSFIINTGALTIKTEFKEATVTGTLDGGSYLRKCVLNALNYVNGTITDCVINNIITLGGGARAEFYDCYSGQPIATAPIIDMGGTGQALIMRNWHGVLHIQNRDAASTDDFCVGVSPGIIRYGASFDASGGNASMYGQGLVLTETGAVPPLMGGFIQTTEIHDLHGQVERAVYIDTELVSNGNGYQQSPYNNWSDAVDYAEANGLKRLIVLADATVDRQLKNFIITGVGTPVIDTNGQNLDKSQIDHCTVLGSYTGTVVMQECNVTGTNTTLNGFFENCALGSTFIVPDGGVAFIKDCSAFIIGQTPPTFSVGGVSGTGVLIVTGWNGGAIVEHVNQPTDDVKFINNAARIILDGATCTDGNINVIGVARLIKNGATSTIVEETVDPTHVRDMFTRLGLNVDNPFTDTPTQFKSANNDIVIDITGDGVTTTTQTRQ